ncbi:MAG: molybdate transport system permease protein [Planctomycetota bacterium]|jgi:molybdate transport system permease protein
MQRLRLALLGLACLLSTSAVGAPLANGVGGQQEEILVHAASSLQAVCEEFAEIYTEWRPEVSVRFNFGGSNDLANQLLVGAPGDVFLSADYVQLDRLLEAGLVAEEARAAFCSNLLVVVERAGETASELRSLQDLQSVERVSIADPAAVPGGVYARAWLEQVGAWDAIEPRLVPSINARAALGAVEAGACAAGIVYRTDALLSKRVRVAFEIPLNEQPDIRYGGALLGNSTGPGAREFLDMLCGKTGALVLAQHGFLPAAAEGKKVAAVESTVPSAWTALWVSLKIAALATLIVFIPGVALGWVLSRKRFRGRSLVETFVALPLVLPPTAIGYVLLRSFASDGPLGKVLSSLHLDLLLTWKGAVIAAALMSLPLVARTARIAFDAVDPRLEFMGASLGWSRLTVLRRVTLPLARRGLLAAGVLGFSRALGEFGATVIVAGNIPGETQTLALAIFQDIQLGRDAHAMQLLWISVVIAFLAVWTSEFFLARNPEGQWKR